MKTETSRECREYALHFRITNEQHERLMVEAAQMGVSLSNLVRQKLGLEMTQRKWRRSPKWRG